jgi:hypothetical protein
MRLMFKHEMYNFKIRLVLCYTIFSPSTPTLSPLQVFVMIWWQTEQIAHLRQLMGMCTHTHTHTHRESENGHSHL